MLNYTQGKMGADRSFAEAAKTARPIGWFLTLAGLLGGSAMAIRWNLALPSDRLPSAILVGSMLTLYLVPGVTLLAIHRRIRRGRRGPIMAATVIGFALALFGIAGFTVQMFSRTPNGTAFVFATVLVIISGILTHKSGRALSKTQVPTASGFEPEVPPSQPVSGSAPLTRIGVQSAPYRHSIVASESAARTARIVGWIYLVLGLLLLIGVVFVMVLAPQWLQRQAHALLLIVVVLILAPAAVLLSIYPAIERGKPSAVVTAMVIGIVLSVLGSINVVSELALLNLTALPKVLGLVPPAFLWFHTQRAWRKIRRTDTLPDPTPAPPASFRLPPRPQR